MIRVKFKGAKLGINKVIGEYVYLHSPAKGARQNREGL
jgi:hypothetical protein